MQDGEKLQNDFQKLTVFLLRLILLLVKIMHTF